MNKTRILIFIIFLSFAAIKLSAQGQFVNRPIAIGYSYSTLRSNNETYILNTFGLTLGKNFDLYYGSCNIKNKVLSLAGTTIYIRKQEEVKFFPALTINMLFHDTEAFPGAGLGLFIRAINVWQIKGYLVPNFSVYNDRSKWVVSSSIFLSLNLSLFEHLNLYIEPEKSFDNSDNPILEVGVSYQFGNYRYK